MKKLFIVTLFSCAAAAAMDSQSANTWEAKMRARRVRFFARLPYFNSARACDNDMTTESDAEQSVEDGLMSEQELSQWRAERADARIAHDQMIQAGTKDVRVEAALKKVVTEGQSESLYEQLNRPQYQNMPPQNALMALGYEADVE